MDETLEKDRINELIEAIMKVAREDYTVQIKLSGKNDDLDSIAMGLNMMIDDIRTGIEQLKKTEEERARATFLASTVAAMVDAIVVFDLEAKLVSANEAYSKMFGIEDVKGHLGKSLLELPGIGKQKPEEMGKFMPLIREVIEKGKAGPTELLLVTMDNRELPVTVAGGTIKDAQGNPTHIVALLRDITDLKQAEKELKEKVKELEDFHDVAVGRELKMIKMEEEINRLKKQGEGK